VKNIPHGPLWAICIRPPNHPLPPRGSNANGPKRMRSPKAWPDWPPSIDAKHFSLRWLQ
jgi:hypothetical protein